MTRMVCMGIKETLTRITELGFRYLLTRKPTVVFTLGGTRTHRVGFWALMTRKSSSRFHMLIDSDAIFWFSAV